MAFHRRAWLAVASTLVLVAALAAYWYFSPYLVIRTLHSAAEAGDVDTINEHVDFPRLRTSIKGQLVAAMAASMRGAQDNPLAAAGAAVGRGMIGGVVEVLVQPQVLMYSIRTGLARPRPAGQEPSLAPSAAAGSETETPDSASPPRQQVRWRAERLGTDRVVFYRVDGQRDDNVGLVLDRYGFASWKLSGMQLHLPSAGPAGAGG